MWQALGAFFNFVLEWFKWVSDPNRRRIDDLKKINDEIAELEIIRDKALAENDSNGLSTVVARLLWLRNKAKDYLPQ